ncbi:MAG TPA: type III pantothenate kinase [Geminicoccaceae bacterium]|nr:type III pantothenate kinase [Geminicoccaceae bacterium]
MLLAIDVGNTNTVFALYRERECVGQWRLATNRERTSDEYAAALIQLMELKGLHHDRVDAVLITSVVPQAIQPLRWMVRDFFACRAFVVGDDLEHPIPVKLDNPKELGADRIVNVVGALTLYRPPLVIVDFGTATTFDVVDEEGAHCGGVIATGINLSLEALSRAAAQLPRIAVAAPARMIGRSTVEAMQSGIYWGYVSLVEGVFRRIEEEYGRPMTCIATGGLAPLFAKGCAVLEHVHPELTMLGLLEIYERNRDLVRCDRERVAAG